MKKSYLLLAAAAISLASCSNDDFLAEGLNPDDNGTDEITFSMSAPNQTRAKEFTGADAAAKLNYYFTVEGYKGSTTASESPAVVFDNYRIHWVENSANTTESNTNNWEYVGVDPIKHATDNGISSQTIKYWDYTQSQYDFIAWSTGSKTAIYEGTPTDGQVLVSEITPGKPATGTKGSAYTFTGSANDLSQTYIANLVTVKKSSKMYGQPVTFTFRQLGTKVRIAIYETVPGYSVKNVQFYSAAASDDAQATTAKLFTTTDNQIYTKGTYTVYYPTVDGTGSQEDYNYAHVSFAGDGDQTTTIDWGGMNYTIAEQGEKTAGSVFLGRSSDAASYAGNTDDNYYVTYLPNESGTNLNLRVNYTLESIDGSGEVIDVKGATAQVPSIYTTWKSGYAYTYIFKISDKTNGYTGVYDPENPDGNTTDSNPAGLYPITFDAVVENAEEDGTQETITTVSAPSITTYAQHSTVVNNNEYTTSDGDIYVTVNAGDTDPGLATGKLVALTNKAKLYTLSADKTEAEVIDALAIQDNDNKSASTVTVKGRNGLELTEKDLTLTNEVKFGADGNTIKVGTDEAAKFTPATGTYAFVYTPSTTAPTETKVYQKKNFTTGADVTGYYHYAFKKATAGDVKANVIYYTQASSSDPYVKHSVFLGQTVSNCYVNNASDSKVAASGYAVSNTTYYYTLDKGQHYKEAHNVAYAGFATAELYTLSGSTYTKKTDTTPVTGTAYYYKETDGTYTWCVILPEQADNLYVVDTDEANIVACADLETAKEGYIYLDRYVKNDGVRYVKVIKVQ